MTRWKTGKCPKCLPSGGALLQTVVVAVQGTVAEVWECTHCGTRANKRAYKQADSMTPSQRGALETLKREHLRQLSRGSSEVWEYKRWTYELQSDGTVVLDSIVGVAFVDDNAPALRDRRHISIGRKGSMRLLNAVDGPAVWGINAIFKTKTR